MTDTMIKVREHYSASGLSDRIKAALATITPESQALTVAQLAPLDQFHTEGFSPPPNWLEPLGSIRRRARWKSRWSLETGTSRDHAAKRIVSEWTTSESVPELLVREFHEPARPGRPD